MQLTEAEARLLHILDTDETWQGASRLGVAVSGGGDSMALLHILAGAAQARGVVLEAATVDHGLRPEAAEEARFVGAACARLAIAHETLVWTGWSGQGNLQAEARAARYRLLAAWAEARELPAVALAHTQDDVAETFLMRLARGAGLDGLAAMARVFRREGAVFWRPALETTRADLRAFLTRHGLDWREDPSNTDRRFARVKARDALATLAQSGLDAATLGKVAQNLAAARGALEQYTAEVAARAAHIEAGDVVLLREQMATGGQEIERRLLRAALVWVSGAHYAPRGESLRDLMAALGQGRAHNLHGCLVIPEGGQLRITRELKAVRDLRVASSELWDGRWQLSGPHRPGLEVGALGAGLESCPRHDTGLPRATLRASPAIWADDVLVAAPLAGLANGWSASLAPKKADFHLSLLSR